MSKSLNEWGRFLALVLRYKPQAVGIELDAHGWAQVEALLVAFNRIEAFNNAYVGADCCRRWQAAFRIQRG